MGVVLQEALELHHDSGSLDLPDVLVVRDQVPSDVVRACRMDAPVDRLVSEEANDDRAGPYQAQFAASFSAAHAGARPFVPGESAAQPDQCGPAAE